LLSDGTLAMLHPPDDPNGGGSAAFFLKADPSYTPAGNINSKKQINIIIIHSLINNY
jgi:hypothetical protein